MYNTLLQIQVSEAKVWPVMTTIFDVLNVPRDVIPLETDKSPLKRMVGNSFRNCLQL